MSVQALSWVLDHSESRLAARLVLLSIANHANEVGDNAWPSVSRIAREAHVTDRQVQRALVSLVHLGELLIIHGAGPGGAHVYQVCMGGDKLSPGGVTNRTGGGDISDGAIRKNRPLTVQTINPPTPLFQRGVSKRDVRAIGKHIAQFWQNIFDLQGLIKERYRGLSDAEVEQLANESASDTLLIPVAVIEEVRKYAQTASAVPGSNGHSGAGASR